MAVRGRWVGCLWGWAVSRSFTSEVGAAGYGRCMMIILLLPIGHLEFIHMYRAPSGMTLTIYMVTRIRVKPDLHDWRPDDIKHFYRNNSEA
jgi:hypothetical protein